MQETVAAVAILLALCATGCTSGPQPCPNPDCECDRGACECGCGTGCFCGDFRLRPVPVETPE